MSHCSHHTVCEELLEIKISNKGRKISGALDKTPLLKFEKSLAITAEVFYNSKKKLTPDNDAIVENFDFIISNISRKISLMFLDSVLGKEAQKSKFSKQFGRIHVISI